MNPETTLPGACALFQNCPTLYNLLTKIRYDVHEDENESVDVEIKIYDIHGR